MVRDKLSFKVEATCAKWTILHCPEKPDTFAPLVSSPPQGGPEPTKAELQMESPFKID